MTHRFLKCFIIVVTSAIITQTTQGFAGRNWDAVAACQDNPKCATCLVKGTKVQISPSGKSINVETVKSGDKVLSLTQSFIQMVSTADDYLFKPARVETTTVTKNTRALYALKDSQGHSLIGTENHPIATANRGFVALKNLRSSDLVITLKGKSKVVSITPSNQKEVKVFNLVVGDTDLIKSQSTHTFFANGILVGDLYVQALLFFGKKVTLY
jgi:Pretoxin HINT domain